MRLTRYRKKRDFEITSEPAGTDPLDRQGPDSPLIYVVQKHRASHLHYDFRLEWRGTLMSWAVPKGPSIDPAIKRLAMQVEDHPIDYASFEGVIPAGEYGGGTVMVWDRGTWEPEVPDVDAALKRGDLKFTLRGKKLSGSWVLVRTRGFGKNPKRPSWLLIKHRDRYASTTNLTEELSNSAISGRSLEQIAREAGGDVAQAATGDPPERVSQSRALKARILPKKRRRS